jgi:hypothetical protein
MLLFTSTDLTGTAIPYLIYHEGYNIPAFSLSIHDEEEYARQIDLYKSRIFKLKYILLHSDYVASHQYTDKHSVILKLSF